MYYLTVNKPVDIGVEGAHWCSIGGVCKRAWCSEEDDLGYYAVTNELIAGRLALMLGLPVPPGGVAHDDAGRPWYVCMQFGHKGEAPPEVDPEELVAHHPDIAAGIATFDIWVNNSRHEENLAFIPGAVQPTMFDHARALFEGWLEKQHRMTQMETDFELNHHCLLGLLKHPQHVHHWMGRIERLPDELIRVPILAAQDLGLIDTADAEVAYRFLLARRDSLGSAVRHNLGDGFAVQRGLFA